MGSYIPVVRWFVAVSGGFGSFVYTKYTKPTVYGVIKLITRYKVLD